MQAEGVLAPRRDGWGSWRGGRVGGGRRGSRGHGEAAVSSDLAENLAPWSLGPQRTDLNDRTRTEKRHNQGFILVLKIRLNYTTSQ